MSLTRVILPKLGLTMEEGRVVAWHHAEGDAVREGDVLFEVETDKATMEVPSPVSGVLRRILVAADASAPVASVIALITSTADEEFAERAAPMAAPTADPLGRYSPSPSASRSAPDAPRAQRPLDDQPPSPSTTVPARGSSSADRVAASPAARKRAAELGVDLSTVVASKPPRISIEDVEAASAAPAAQAGEKRVPLTRMRKAIAAAMSRSTREAPQFAIARDVDMSSANERRKRAGASYTDVVVFAAARALAKHPRLRSRFDGDAIIESASVHIGLAIALEDGLIVPVIRDADRKDLAALAEDRERLEAGAHAGKLTARDLTGAAFSVSNLGPLGVDRFQALVNPPEAAILALGRIRDQVVARDGVAVVRPTVTLTLSVDHRVADGADAARFLADLVQDLESTG
ncbi:MAG TPA: dihydrolipoamide acetyltransferase family protein [Candidatus Limnocylindria bacterium]|nr:dihydrolipoamide acetyltransferase family protein [Candidatus Limnocylindria bacterium]